MRVITCCMLLGALLAQAPVCALEKEEAKPSQSQSQSQAYTHAPKYAYRKYVKLVVCGVLGVFTWMGFRPCVSPQTLSPMPQENSGPIPAALPEAPIVEAVDTPTDAQIEAASLIAQNHFTPASLELPQSLPVPEAHIVEAVDTPTQAQIEAASLIAQNHFTQAYFAENFGIALTNLLFWSGAGKDIPRSMGLKWREGLQQFRQLNIFGFTQLTPEASAHYYQANLKLEAALAWILQYSAGRPPEKVCVGTEETEGDDFAPPNANGLRQAYKTFVQQALIPYGRARGWDTNQIQTPLLEALSGDWTKCYESLHKWAAFQLVHEPGCYGFNLRAFVYKSVLGVPLYQTHIYDVLREGMVAEPIASVRQFPKIGFATLTSALQGLALSVPDIIAQSNFINFTNSTVYNLVYKKQFNAMIYELEKRLAELAQANLLGPGWRKAYLDLVTSPILNAQKYHTPLRKYIEIAEPVRYAMSISDREKPWLQIESTSRRLRSLGVDIVDYQQHVLEVLIRYDIRNIPADLRVLHSKIEW
jgi:hypothetical protein